jgi:catalase
LTETEQQFLINAIRFETSQLESDVVKQNVLIQLNRISHDVAVRVAEALGMDAPAADPTYYHDNSTSTISIMNNTLPSIATLKVGILASVSSNSSLSYASALASAFSAQGATPKVVAERLASGVDVTYSAADATNFDGIIVVGGAESLFASNTTSTLFPAARPLEILQSGYRYGKPVGSFGSSASKAFQSAGISAADGVYFGNTTVASDYVSTFEQGLKIFKFADRFALDN